MPRPADVITLTPEQRSALESWTRSRTLSQRRMLRAKIILLAADGVSSRRSAQQLGVMRQTVVDWRRRFAESGLDGLEEAPGRGRPPSITQAQKDRVIALTLRKPNDGSTHWSIRRLAPIVGLSYTSVQRIWKEHGLQPHRSRTFKHSTDPRLEEKVTDVVGLYLHPPEKAVVICVDEKSQIQALDRSQPLLPMRPGQPERRTHDYVRHGTTTLVAGLDIATGQVTGRCYQRHRHQEFLRFLEHLARAYPRGPAHLVLDNYSTHRHPNVAGWLRRHPRFHLHFTPTSASWLNQVETFFSILQRRAIKRGVFTSVVELKRAIQRFLDRWNDQCKPFAWVKTPEQILGTRNGLRFSESRH
jgi:transposase